MVIPEPTIVGTLTARPTEVTSSGSAGWPVATPFSPRSGRQHKVSHPSRDARLGTPPWGEAKRNPRNRVDEIIKARGAADSGIHAFL